VVLARGLWRLVLLGGAVAALECLAPSLEQPLPQRDVVCARRVSAATQVRARGNGKRTKLRPMKASRPLLLSQLASARARRTAALASAPGVSRPRQLASSRRPKRPTRHPGQRPLRLQRAALQRAACRRRRALRRRRAARPFLRAAPREAAASRGGVTKP
jgi:hypothetical protein